MRRKTYLEQPTFTNLDTNSKAHRDELNNIISWEKHMLQKGKNTVLPPSCTWDYLYSLSTFIFINGTTITYFNAYDNDDVTTLITLLDANACQLHMNKFTCLHLPNSTNA